MMACAASALIILCLLDPAPGQRPAEATAAYAPIFSLPGGCYDRDILLEIKGPESGTGKRSDVIFTVDGSTPTPTHGTRYTQPIRLSAATPGVTAIRARAVAPGSPSGPIVSASYIVGLPATLPAMSLIVDPDDLWDPERGILANPDGRGAAWERPVDVTFVDRDRRSGFQVPAGVRLHGGASRDLEKKALRLYFRQEYGLSWLEYPLFEDSGAPIKRLVLHNGGQDWYHPGYSNWTLLRNQVADRLASGVGAHATRSRPVLLFVNGNPWGIYYLRERVDERFLAQHYGITSADFLLNPGLPEKATVSMGSRERWDQLIHFLETHDLVEDANYAYVQGQIDIASFIDYCILQIYTANTDWPHHNVNQFRSHAQGGTWQWMFWDSDHGFGLEPYGGSVDANTITRVMDQEYPGTDGRDTLLLRKLLGNPAFLNRFLARTADLLNSALAPPMVIQYIDALATELAPDMAYETTRWPGATNWVHNVEELRDFARRRPDFVRQHLIDRFGLAGTVQLAFASPAGGEGSVAVNGVLIQPLPWRGTFFSGIPVEVTAAPAPGYRFAGWDAPQSAHGATITLTTHTTQTFRPRFEPLAAGVPQPGDVAFASVTTNPDSHLADDRLELRVTCPDGADLRGWRLTDNDTKTATDEGSLIFPDLPALARVPQDTRIRIFVGQPDPGAAPPDDLDPWDRQMVLHAANGILDTHSDPGFNLGPQDNVALLAPGSTGAFGDDRGVAFMSTDPAVTPASFGVLVDGVRDNTARDISLTTESLAHSQPSGAAGPACALSRETIWSGNCSSRGLAAAMAQHE